MIPVINKETGERMELDIDDPDEVIETLQRMGEPPEFYDIEDKYFYNDGRIEED